MKKLILVLFFIIGFISFSQEIDNSESRKKIDSWINKKTGKIKDSDYNVALELISLIEDNTKQINDLKSEMENMMLSLAEANVRIGLAESRITMLENSNPDDINAEVMARLDSLEAIAVPADDYVTMVMFNDSISKISMINKGQGEVLEDLLEFQIFITAKDSLQYNTTQNRINNYQSQYNLLHVLVDTLYQIAVPSNNYFTKQEVLDLISDN